MMCCADVCGMVPGVTHAGLDEGHCAWHTDMTRLRPCMLLLMPSMVPLAQKHNNTTMHNPQLKTFIPLNAARVCAGLPLFACSFDPAGNNSNNGSSGICSGGVCQKEVWDLPAVLESTSSSQQLAVPVHFMLQ